MGNNVLGTSHSRKKSTFYCKFYDLNSFFPFWEQGFTFYQLITLVTLMKDPLKTAVGSWVPSIKIIIIIIIISLLLLLLSPSSLLFLRQMLRE